jgi:hypothetical protein
MQWAATDNRNSFTNWDYAEGISPRINLQLGVHDKGFAGSRRVRRGLAEQEVPNLLGVHRRVEHFGVTLEPLRVFLICLNQPDALAISRKGCKQGIQSILACNTSLKCRIALSYSKECSDATPVSNSDCSFDEHDVGKETFPSFSAGHVMRSMLMLLPKGRGNKKDQWEEKSVGVPVSNCFPGHNGTMPGNSVRCSPFEIQH